MGFVKILPFSSMVVGLLLFFEEFISGLDFFVVVKSFLEVHHLIPPIFGGTVCFSLSLSQKRRRICDV